jgi:hypothetical protein
MITTEFCFDAIEQICKEHVALNLKATRLLSCLRDNCIMHFNFNKDLLISQNEKSLLLKLYLLNDPIVYHVMQNVQFSVFESEIEFPGKVIFDNTSKNRILEDCTIRSKFTDWEELYCELTFGDMNSLTRRLTLRDDLNQFHDFPSKLPPFNEFIYIDPFVNTFNDKQLKDNLLRMAKFYADPMTEFNLIIISSEISIKNIETHNKNNQDNIINNPDEWFGYYFKKIETLIEELDIKCCLTLMDLLNISTEKGEDSKLFHDRILITNYCQVDFGNSFSFFSGEEVFKNAKKTKVTFNSHLDSDAVRSANSTLVEIDKLIRDNRFRIQGSQSSRFIEF